jgi:sirohydrochlorin cobaltochelatase
MMAPHDLSHAALVILGHGSTVNSSSSSSTRQLTTAIAALGIFREVRCAFLKESPYVRDALDLVASEDVYVTPNFISEGYFTQTILPRELQLTGPLTLMGNRRVKYCRPVGSHPGMTELVAQRARESAPDIDPANATLVIVGHGTPQHKNSATAVHAQVAAIAGRGIWGQVIGAYLEEPPFISNWQEFVRSSEVVVVPFFIADGMHAHDDLPRLLGMQVSHSPGETVSQTVAGHTVHCTAAVGSDPAIAMMIVDQARRWEEEHGAT